MFFITSNLENYRNKVLVFISHLRSGNFRRKQRILFTNFCTNSKSEQKNKGTFLYVIIRGITNKGLRIKVPLLLFFLFEYFLDARAEIRGIFSVVVWIIPDL